MKATSNDAQPEDGNALAPTTLQLNPEALKGVPPLPDLDQIEVIFVQPVHPWTRWKEGLMIHVVGSGLFAAIAFTAGLMSAGGGYNAEGSPKQVATCTTDRASAPENAD